MSADRWTARNVKDSTRGEVRDAEGNLVALVHRVNADDSTGAECVRRTEMIASAPDLLAALERVGCRSARVYANGNTCEERLAVDPDGVDRCHVCAAIAKARGGK